MATVKYEGVKKKREGGGLGNLIKKVPPWGWILIAVILLLMILWYRNKQAQAAAQTQSDQNASGTQTQGAADQGATDSYLQGYQDAMLGAGGAYGGGYGGGGGFSYPTTTPGLIDPSTIPPGTVWGGNGGVTTPNQPAYTPPPITINEPAITVTTPAATSTGGGLNSGAGGSAGGGGWSSAQLALVAPGASHPSYNLVRPAGHPNALWSGSKKPGANWVGVGGGWWVKK